MNGHSERRLIVLYTCCILISMSSSRINGQDSLRSLIKCKPIAQVDSGKVQRVLLRSFPFSDFDSIAVPSQGAGLLSVLAKKDVLSVGIQQIRFPKAEDAEVKNRFFAGVASGPDMFCAILHIRGNEITIFPRVMLVHPWVALSLVKPNDVVLTMELENNSLQKTPSDSNHFKRVQLLNEADPIHKWFHENFANTLEQEAINIQLTGELLPPAMLGNRTIKPIPAAVIPVLPSSPFPTPLPTHKTGPMSLSAIFGDRLSNSLDLKNLIKENEIGDILAVSVVKRSVGPYVMRYVVPLKDAGAFRSGSQYYQRLFSESTGWNPRLDLFLQFPLVEGDILEVSTARAVPLFQQQGLLVPLN